MFAFLLQRSVQAFISLLNLVRLVLFFCRVLCKLFISLCVCLFCCRVVYKQISCDVGHTALGSLVSIYQQYNASAMFGLPCPQCMQLAFSCKPSLFQKRGLHSSPSRTFGCTLYAFALHVSPTALLMLHVYKHNACVRVCV